MYCQDCGMLKSNCVCGRYNKSDKNQEINEEAKADFSSDAAENESQVNSRQGKIQKEDGTQNLTNFYF